MPTNPTDPFDGMPILRFCSMCDHSDKNCCCDRVDPMPRYLYEPAMRRAVVEWMRDEAPFLKTDAVTRHFVFKLAEKLERGGHDEG